MHDAVLVLSVGSLLGWFLPNRYQRVRKNGKLSIWVSVSSGVRQFLALGMVYIFINTYE